MEIPKPTEGDKAYFSSLVPSDPLVEVKPMFGNLGAFVNGNMFMGLFGADVGLKLGDADQAALLVEKGAGPFGPEGHRMGGYVAIPASWRAHPVKAEAWVAKAFAGAAALPAKVKSPGKRAGTNTSPAAKASPATPAPSGTAKAPSGTAKAPSARKKTGAT